QLQTGLGVASSKRTPSRRPEPLGGSPPERTRRGVRLPEFDAIPVRLILVIAEDLFELEAAFRGTLLEPRCVSFVQARSELLRNRLIWDVANQKVRKAVSVLAGENRSVGPDQLLAYEGKQVWSHVCGVGADERRHRRLVKHHAFYGRRLDSRALALAEKVESR